MLKKTLSSLALATLGASPLPAAQNIETIIVTAARFPQASHAISGRVTVIDLDDWQGAGISIADVLREIPGLSVSQLGGAGTLAELRMRGGESSHTRVLLDGVDLSDPTSGVVNFAHLSTAGIERVEVVRGAPGPLWGSQAISGVVNLVSRTGGRSSLTQKSGSNRRHETTLRLATETDDFRMQASARRFQTDGENVSLSGSERDGYRNNTAQWSALWSPSSRTDLRLSARHTHANLEYDGGWPLPSDQNNTSRNLRTYGNAILRSRTDSFHYQASVGYLRTSNKNHQETSITETRGRRVQADGMVWRDFEKCFLGRPCAVGAGMEWERERYDRGGIEPLSFLSSGVFTTLKWRPDPQMTLDLALRRDNNQDFEDADTWRVSLAYQWPDHPTRLYLASGIGIANPTLTERYGYFPNAFQGNPNLLPERSRNTEIGIEHNPSGACCRISVSVFDQRLSDEIQYHDPDGLGGPLLPTSINGVRDSDRWGAELEFGFDPHPGWTFSADYAYLQATEPAPGDADDRKEVRRPRHQYRLALSRRSAQWRFRLDFTTARGLLDGGTALDNHNLINLTARHALTSKLDLLFETRNLLDDSYQEIRGYAAPRRNFSTGLEWRFD